jgi:hypothetical protein
MFTGPPAYLSAPEYKSEKTNREYFKSFLPRWMTDLRRPPHRSFLPAREGGNRREREPPTEEGDFESQHRNLHGGKSAEVDKDVSRRAALPPEADGDRKRDIKRTGLERGQKDHPGNRPHPGPETGVALDDLSGNPDLK